MEVIEKKMFKLGEGKWGSSQQLGTAGGIVEFSIATANFSNSFTQFDFFINENIFIEEITEAFAVWERVADIRFTQVSDRHDVDIRLGWLELDGEGGVLGETTIPASGPLQTVTVALDFGEDWFTGGDAPANRIDFSYVAAHEIGHALGIDHSEELNSLMSPFYSTGITELQSDDMNAIRSIYGEIDDAKVSINRFFNSEVGGHLFTADLNETLVLGSAESFNAEGVGFQALSKEAEEVAGSLPVYRFFNTQLGSHFFTISELEKSTVEGMEHYNFEGVAFRTFEQNTLTTTPVFRFFDTVNGGHFFTVSDTEKDFVIELDNYAFEGEVFNAFL